MNKEVTWNDIEKSLNFTPEEESAIQLEVDLIQATINAREKSNLSQRDLSKICGLKQPVIARIESRARSPKVETLLKMLLPMGYTLKVMPIDRHITKK
jgi:ribosome-binding protein aMBF1 (putative translation factor)